MSTSANGGRIRFECPSCQAVLSCPERKAGEKTGCPKCGQRLQVPQPPRRNKTVLGRIVSTVGSIRRPQPAERDDGVQEPPPVRRPAPPAIPPVAVQEDEEPAAPPKRTGTRVGFVIALCASLAIVATCGLCGVGSLLLAPKQANNAACPDCFYETHIDFDKYSTVQKAQVEHRCPVCGHSNELLGWESVWELKHKVTDKKKQ